MMIVQAVNTARPAPRNFTLMVIGQIVSLMGSELLRFSLSLYVLDLTGRADVYAGLYAISSLPLLLSPIGGAIADRFHRRNLMVLFDFGSSLLVFGFLAALFAGRATVPVIGAVMVLLAVISSMYRPAVQASIPLLCARERLEAANGIVSGVDALAGMMAPVLGGVLYGLCGLSPLILLSAAAFALSAVMELFIEIPFSRREQSRAMLPTIAGDLREGFGYVLRQPYIRKSMLLAALLNLVLTPFLIVGLPVILRVTMHSSETMTGIGMGLCQLSMVAGALCVGAFARWLRIRTLHRWLLAIALLLLPMTLALTPLLLGLGYAPSFALFFAGAVPLAMAMTVVSVFVMTLVQKRTPTHLLGKVMAIITGASQCAAPVGQAVQGVLFERFAGRVWAPALMVFAALLGMVWLARRLYRGVEEN